MFSSAQTRSLIAVSAHDGTQGEGIVVNTWSRSGYFYLRVKGRNGAFASDTPFHLAVTLLNGECGSVNPVLPASDTTPEPGAFQTLILTNLAKTDGAGADITALQTNLASLAALKRVNGLVLDVGGDARVKAAAVQAQANPGCVFAMNLQAGAIKDLVNAVWQNDSSLEYIVLVGNDHAIPFFRYPDNALLASETDFAPPVLDNSTSQASLKSGYFLSQDAYGSAEDLSYKAETIPVPDLAVGRLVETAADINHLLDAYLGTPDGIVSPTKALVTGYDFLTDDANAVKTQLQASLGSSAVDSLIMDNTLSPADPSAWNADDLRQSLLGSRHDLVFLAGHFSASSALAADYKTRLLSSDVLSSSTDFTNTLVYSAGCHSGYNIVNADDVSGVTQEPDWAQVFADKGATFIGGTGYQYGDTDFIAYSEQLYLDFTLQLRYGSGPVSVGQALVKAKQAYLAGTPEMRGIHEKALLEATLFGLPMMQYDLPAPRIDAPVDSSLINSLTPYDTEPGSDLGLRVADLDVNPIFTDHTVTLNQPPASAGTAKVNPSATVDAFYLAGPDGQVVNPAEPVLPLDLLNVTSPDEDYILRGVGWRGGEYTDLTGILPLTGAATQDLRAPHVPFFSDTFYPVRPWNVNYFAALSGSGDTTRLALLPAQYRSSSPGSLTGLLRRFDGMHFRLFYSSNIQTYDSDHNWSNTPALSAPPDISDITSSIKDGTVSFAVTVTGDPAAGIQAVWIVYTFDNGGGSGTWRPLDLQQDLTPDPDDNQPHDSRLWKGTLALDGASAANLRFVVQAVNGVGLVTMMTNQGAYYQANVDPAVLPVGLKPVTLALESPAASGTYGSQQAFTARLMQAGSPLSGLPVTFTLGGLERLAVTGSDGRATVHFYLAAPPADTALEANFAGNSTYASGAATSPFEIQPGSSTLVLGVKDQTVSPGAHPGFTATVTSSGLPLVGKSIALTLASAGVTRYSSVAVTDYNGQATWQLPAQSPGTYTLKAWFGLPVSTDLDLSSPYYTGSFDTTSLSVSNQTTYLVFLPLVFNRPFNFKGFFPHVVNPPTLNKVEAGNQVALLFSLGGNFGQNIFASGYPALENTSCQAPSFDPLQKPSLAATGTLAYDPILNWYSYLWKTDPTWAGTCGTLVMKFIDGSVRYAFFQFIR